ncbi:MAG: ParB/RepB/Spo0J family partition protein [Gammaproteobacteria bacterium]|nr:ParB/RepB/Spo0J family partition protein [Gammaproteobacteria bacterium]
MAAKKRGLGRGLDALLRTNNDNSSSAASVSAPAKRQVKIESTAELTAQEPVDGDLKQLAIELMQPGVYQPRIDMHAAALEELAESIKSQGIIQPVIVRRISSLEENEKRYEIIAGERRWRAAQMAGLDNIPAIIRDVTDKETIAMALIENIQREDLNPIEEANSIKRLIKEFNMTHQGAADAVGRSRTAVSNLLRLLDLDPETKTLLENGDLEMGHARALLSLGQEIQYETAKQVISQELSVRETEKFIKRLLNPKEKVQPQQPDPDIISLQQKLSEQLATKVQFKHSKKGKGSLIISYNTLDELDGILNHIQ